MCQLAASRRRHFLRRLRDNASIKAATQLNVTSTPSAMPGLMGDQTLRISEPNKRVSLIYEFWKND